MNTTHSVGFEPVHAVRTLLSGLTVPYWITGGWAIDPAAGHVTRDHADVNIMMLERHEHALRGLTGVDIQLIANGAPAGSLARRASADRWTCRDGWVFLWRAAGPGSLARQRPSGTGQIVRYMAL